MIFLGGYLPACGYGGPVTSVSNLVTQLGQDYDFRIVCSDHDFGKTEPLPGIAPGWNSVGSAKVLYLPEAELNRTKFREILGEERPDLMYLSSIFHHKMNFPLEREAKSLGIPLILAPRGELDAAALRRGAAKKQVYCTAMRLLGVYRDLHFHTTCETEARAVQERLHVRPERIHQLPNLPAPGMRKDSVYKQPDRLRIMICSRILPNKNQLLAIEAVKKLAFPTVCDLYGPVEDEAYWAQCRQAMADAPAHIKFHSGGLLSSAQVGRELLRHDCLLLPTAFENYGHSISEALLHDCPVVISRGTTPWDDVQAAGAGYTAPLDEPERFTEALREIGEMDAAAYAALLDRLRRYCDEKIRPDGLRKSYSDMFEQVRLERKR